MMTKRDLKLIKSRKKQATKAAKSQLWLSKTSRTPTPNPSTTLRTNPQTLNAELPTLTPAEQAEAARFRALTRERAARQARVRRIVARLQNLDDAPSAA